MKLDSKFFDYVRAKSKAEPRIAVEKPACQWPGCIGSGEHRAPQGRGRDGEYFLFCVDHVREYNKSYNYFSGMSDEDIASFQKDAIVGHRPTWKAGANAWAHGRRDGASARASRQPHAGMKDPFGMFPDTGEKGETKREPHRPIIGNMARKCLNQLNLEASATREEIKLRFKELVKRHHPDANGGDKASEDKLREVIQAYNYLKQAGHC